MIAYLLFEERSRLFEEQLRHPCVATRERSATLIKASRPPESYLTASSQDLLGRGEITLDHAQIPVRQGYHCPLTFIRGRQYFSDDRFAGSRIVVSNDFERGKRTQREVGMRLNRQHAMEGRVGPGQSRTMR